MRCVSSRVMLPELPDARMETRKPIGCSSSPPEKDAGLKPGATLPCGGQAHKRIFRMMAELRRLVNVQSTPSLPWKDRNSPEPAGRSTAEAGAVEGEAV